MAQAPSITFLVSYPGTLLEPSFLDARVTSSSVLNPGSPAGGTAYDAWCLNLNLQLPVPGTYKAAMYSPYEAMPAGLTTVSKGSWASLDSVSWLLNYYNGSNAGISFGEVQSAIWQLMGYKYPVAAYLAPQDPADISALVSLALGHDGYVPDAGEAIGIVLDTTSLNGATHYQPLVLETRAARLGDLVWEDRDADGVQDAGEQGIAGAKVELVRDLNGDGQFTGSEILATTLTDAAGRYGFKGLMPGLDYQVRFTRPDGFDRTSPRQADGSAASGANSDAPLSGVIVLSPGEYGAGIDAGFYRTASLGDRVWEDGNGNGRQDDGEAGIAGATVQLRDGGGTVVAATTTDATGHYAFTGLQPGTYDVQFVAPAGFTATLANAAGDAADSDADASGVTGPYTLGSGDAVMTVDAGFYRPIAGAHAPSITISVFYPGTLLEPSLLDARVTSGSAALNPGSPAGGTAYDAWCLNMNVQMPVPATYKATMYSSYELAVVAANVSTLGTSNLANLDNVNWLLNCYDGHNAGISFGEVQSAIWQLLGYQYPVAAYLAPQDVADINALVSLALAHDGYVPEVGEAIGIVLDTVSGTRHYQPLIIETRAAGIGDAVWEDLDADGVRDAGEQGIAGAQVELVRDLDGDGQFAGSEILATTLTDASGHYGFKGLTPGLDYRVRFTAPDGFDGHGGPLLSGVVVLNPGESHAGIGAGFHHAAFAALSMAAEEPPETLGLLGVVAQDDPASLTLLA